jgi:hypothetical protein
LRTAALEVGGKGQGSEVRSQDAEHFVPQLEWIRFAFFNLDRINRIAGI